MLGCSGKPLFERLRAQLQARTRRGWPLQLRQKRPDYCITYVPQQDFWRSHAPSDASFLLRGGRFILFRGRCLREAIRSAQVRDAPGLASCSQRQPFSDMQPVNIPWYGRVSEGRPCSTFDFQEEEEEDRAMNTASKPGPHTQTDRGTCPGMGL